MIVGIDLGTTHSLIGVYDGGEPQLFMNPLGKLLTPSVVGVLDDSAIVIGEIAKERLTTHPHLTASLFKRSMGTQKKIKLGDKSFLPEELSALLIQSLIESAEAATGKKVTEAVISVPAYFSDAQRKATKVAGELAGIKVERLINEPTAAALAYNLQERGDKDHFLIIDLGGGTFDISILEIFDDVVEVHATAGDNFLGGEDFTTVLEEAFLKAHSLDRTLLPPTDRGQLKNQFERVKKDLTNSAVAEIKINLLGREYDWSVTRDEFQKIAEPLIQKMRAPIERAIRDARLSVVDIAEVILVGGASRMPLVGNLIARMIQRFPLRHIDPDQTVAIGAVIASGLKARNSNLEEILLTDICPYTLGTETGYIDPHTRQVVMGIFTPLITRNSTVPISKEDTFYPLTEEQGSVRFDVYQGESASVSNNILLGGLDVKIPRAKSKEDRGVTVRFTYDINGILQVETTVLATGEHKEIYLKNNSTTMSEEEVVKRFKELSALKIHPRDQQENMLLISRAERIFQEYIHERGFIQAYLMKFKAALETQDEKVVKEARKEFAQILEQIEA